MRIKMRYKGDVNYKPLMLKRLFLFNLAPLLV